MNTIGERIKHARHTRGLFQYTVASRIGIGNSKLSLIENDKQEPDATTLRRLAAALGCTVAWLQTGTDESPLCAEVATIPAPEIMQMIGVVRAIKNPILNHLADKIETWLRDAVGESIPF